MTEFVSEDRFNLLGSEAFDKPVGDKHITIPGEPAGDGRIDDGPSCFPDEDLPHGHARTCQKCGQAISQVAIGERAGLPETAEQGREEENNQRYGDGIHGGRPGAAKRFRHPEGDGILGRDEDEDRQEHDAQVMAGMKCEEVFERGGRSRRWATSFKTRPIGGLFDLVEGYPRENEWNEHRQKDQYFVEEERPVESPVEADDSRPADSQGDDGDHANPKGSVQLTPTTAAGKNRVGLFRVLPDAECGDQGDCLGGNDDNSDGERRQFSTPEDSVRGHGRTVFGNDKGGQYCQKKGKLHAEYRAWSVGFSPNSSRPVPAFCRAAAQSVSGGGKPAGLFRLVVQVVRLKGMRRCQGRDSLFPWIVRRL